MIISLSLNPCIDKSLQIKRLDLDNPNRVTLNRTDVGGKGVNVARVAHTLGGDVLLMGFDYDGQPVHNAMEKESVPCRLTRAEGALRVNLKIREEDTGRTVEINEKGVLLPENTLLDMENMLLDTCKPGDFVSLSGSLPNGAAKDMYASLTQKLKEKGCFTAVDCDGEALQLALESAPSLIKPNLPEFLALTGTKDASRPALLALCREYHKKGVTMICLSLGAEGALLSTEEEAWFCPTADVQVLGTQGAGDSLLGGLLCALSQKMFLPDALAFASAAASASVMRPGTLLCKKEDALSLLPGLQAVRL